MPSYLVWSELSERAAASLKLYGAVVMIGNDPNVWDASITAAARLYQEGRTGREAIALEEERPKVPFEDHSAASPRSSPVEIAGVCSPLAPSCVAGACSPLAASPGTAEGLGWRGPRSRLPSKTGV